MGAYPPRPYGWRVRLDSGERVKEFPDDGPPANRWDQLDLDAIDELELVSVGLVQEADPVVRWELEDAALWVRGHRLDVVLGPAKLTRSPGTLVEPVQKKKASSTHRPGQGATTRLHGFLIGCKRELAAVDGLTVRVLAKVAPDGRIGLRVDAPDPLADAQIAVLLDGEPVRSREAFQAVVGPPEGGAAPSP